MRIYYFSGFGSVTDPHSPKIQMLRELADEVIIVSAIPNTVAAYVSKFLDLYDPRYESIMVGTSLGGFWSSYFGKLTASPWVALNPVFKLPQSLVGKHTAYGSQDGFEFTQEDLEQYDKLLKPNAPGVPGLIIASKDDPYVDVDLLNGMASDHKVVFIPGSDHRLDKTDGYKYLVEPFIQGTLC
jgi:predicted esterase YcpF (UPF0227 family)